MITKTVHIIIFMIIIMVSITLAIAARTVADRFQTYESMSMRDTFKFYDRSTTTSKSTYNEFKKSNKNIVIKIQDIYDQFTNKQYSKIKNSSSDLKLSISSALTSCNILKNKYTDTTDINYFNVLYEALSTIKTYHSGMHDYIIEEKSPYSTIVQAFNTNDYITLFRNSGFYYEQMCTDIYNILESPLSLDSPVKESVTTEHSYSNGYSVGSTFTTELVNVPRTFNLPRQFYCRYNPNSKFL